MPYLRVVRDKRGYETTYLLHSHRDGSHQGSRILYVFRSPGGVRVGRDPFEPEVRRELEAQHPDIAFDWDGLVSGQHVIDANPVERRPRRRTGGAGERTSPPPPPPRRQEAQAQPHTPRLTVPTVIEGDTPELQMRFLALWHGNLCEQLPQRVVDPQRREALMALAQRLNPAGWIEPDEIATGLQGASEALEQLSRVLSRRRRKARRSSPRAVPSAEASSESGTGSAEANEHSEDLGEGSLVDETDESEADETPPDETLT